MFSKTEIMYRIFVFIYILGNRQSAEQAYCVNRLKMQPVKMSSVTCVDCRGILANVEGGSIKNLLESLKKFTHALHPFSEYPCVFALEKNAPAVREI